ncbi:alpha/beta fold hydrolase [Nitrospirillum amazonense]|uniref:Pimeloyl-ACP methyl ester carboxylesterase n=1 Tax=Nitrospirillum amazonense TaxID=28077 RepID=A0A560JAR0_9PROT|nr:alpha/beta hydrolase [Nitrospirillum amazonense]MDG3440923.1 alpha/beta hydrolase [Nitrospirillum amazonense]TWB68025.1 pimeloyl-ACP methyl ester carboxylesterase [Nitrospirillum amazonense]
MLSAPFDRRHFLQGLAGIGATVALGTPGAGAAALSGTGPLNAAAYRSLRRYAGTPFGHVAYMDQGNGPDALFLHGFPLNSFQWRGAIDRLSAHRRCLAPDFLGLGYSRVPDGQAVTPDVQVRMLATFLDSVGANTVDIVANDSGGAVAQLFVTQYPKRVRSLLLTNCDTEPDSPPPALQPVLEMARAGTFADRWLARWVADKDLARSPTGLGGQTFSDPARPTDEAIDYYLGPLVSSPRRKDLVHAYTLGLDPNPLAGIEKELRRVTAPTRIVWGTADTIFDPAGGDYLAGILPNCQGVRHLPQAKLFFPEEYPDIIAEEARKLWGVTA